MTDQKAPLDRLHDALKLRQEVAVDLAKMKKEHASKVVEIGQLADKIGLKEQELAVRDAEAKRIMVEVVK